MSIKICNPFSYLGGVALKFGEKLRTARKKAGMTQSELAAKAGIALKTVINYENGNTYPQNRAVYDRLACILNVNAASLYNETDDFIAHAGEHYGKSGVAQAKALVAQIGGLFAGGELEQEDKDAVMMALQKAYWDAKSDNKKYSSRSPAAHNGRKGRHSGCQI